MPLAGLTPAEASRYRPRAVHPKTNKLAQSIVFATCLGGCDGGDEPAPPTFTELREEVLTPSCVFATCHKSPDASAAGLLNLEGTNDEVHAVLVDVPSSVLAQRIRVIPGDPDASYVIEKLTSDSPEAGERMPMNAELEDYRVELVREWIEAGAAND